MTRARAVAALVWLIVVAGAAATRPFERAERIESLAIGALLLAFASSARVRELLAAIGRPRAAFVIALLGLVLWGQLARDARASFPFLPWSMYTNPAPQPAYLEFEARYRDGATGPFPFGALATFAGSKFLSSKGRALENRITQWLDPARGALAPDRARAELGKLAATYNAQHPGDPVVSIAVVRRVVPIQAFASRESIAREPLLELAIE